MYYLQCAFHSVHHTVCRVFWVVQCAVCFDRWCVHYTVCNEAPQMPSSIQHWNTLCNRPPLFPVYCTVLQCFLSNPVFIVSCIVQTKTEPWKCFLLRFRIICLDRPWPLGETQAWLAGCFRATSWLRENNLRCKQTYSYNYSYFQNVHRIVRLSLELK